jgi:hypothetical protein
MKNKSGVLTLSLLILFVAEILKVYFIMPFPGSQKNETINIAYFLHRYIWVIRILALAGIMYGSWSKFSQWKKWKKAGFIFLLLLYAGIFYLFNFKFLADKMFYQPRNKQLSGAATNRVSPENLVLGVAINNESRAYPIQIIGYHHQVQDTVGGTPVMITYCTVCRTGRVFSPMVDGKKESFRLVGMDHFNAMFEDRSTGSWWRQVSGEAITGKRKGKKLEEIPSRQMRLSAWLNKYPNSLILQPDPSFLNQYKNLEGFDKGSIASSLEKRDPGSWNFKSWIVGISAKNADRAYDWNELVKKRIIQDTLGGIALALFIETDKASFHCWNRRVKGQTLTFTPDCCNLYDDQTKSKWTFNGICIEGALAGEQLQDVQASQEFWHSWQFFHPRTTKYP